MRIVIIGAGAVGSLVGAHLARAGLDPTLVDAWPEHVTAMQHHGLTLTEAGKDLRVLVKALHIGEVQNLHRTPVDLAFVCVKLYDTDWATALIAPYLGATGFTVTLQNGLIEERVAAVVGWQRTLGCIAGGLYAGLSGPGCVARARDPARSPRRVFRVGEVHGRITPRVRSVVDLLRHVDGAEPTANLWGDRWSKLAINGMTSALCAVTGLPLRRLLNDPKAQRVMARLGGEAAAAGLGLGFDVENIFGLAPGRWSAAADGDATAMSEVVDALQAQTHDMGEHAISGMAQDLAKGRRTEVAFINGRIAAAGNEAGTAAPTHVAMVTLLAQMERGAARPNPVVMDRILAVEVARDA